ncbi:MAG: hydroxymethylbilane synthase [Armatimonadota bacterium]|nr:hydroxymethylbilane synthase [bacterium]
MRELIVGSRGSGLALRQTRWVISRLMALNPGVTCDVRVIKTTGDKILDAPLAAIGDKGLFVKEIELALLRGEIDFAVHSAKDLPSEMDDRLTIAAYPEREDPSDALVSKNGGLFDLPPGSVVGTSSVRRRSQLLHARPDLMVKDLRGNLDTRLRKLDDSEYDAIILACAGLRRMGLESRITEALPADVSLPAAGQGALAIQCCADSNVLSVLRTLDHGPTRRCVTAERAVLAALGAGCQTPVAVLACEMGSEMRIDALVASLDGTSIVRKSLSWRSDSGAELGVALAGLLLDSPAAKVLEEVRRTGAPTDMGAAG